MDREAIKKLIKDATANKLQQATHAAGALPEMRNNHFLNKWDFSERLRNLRNEKGLTLNEADNAMKLKRGTVKEWESQRRYPNAESLHKLSVFYDVDIEYLITDTTIRRRAEMSAAEYTGLSPASVERLHKLPPLLIQTLDALLQYGNMQQAFTSQTFTGMIAMATEVKEASEYSQHPSEIDKDEYEIERDYRLALFDASNDLTAMLRALYPLKSRNVPESL